MYCASGAFDLCMAILAYGYPTFLQVGVAVMTACVQSVAISQERVSGV